MGLLNHMFGNATEVNLSEIQNEFSLLSLYINKKLDMLFDNKKCKKN